MYRARFRANAEDPRPINWPLKHPYWITGYGDESATIVAYVDDEEYIYENWPEAQNWSIDFLVEDNEYRFSERFPCPDWFDGGGV